MLLILRFHKHSQKKCKHNYFTSYRLSQNTVQDCSEYSFAGENEDLVFAENLTDVLRLDFIESS